MLKAILSLLLVYKVTQAAFIPLAHGQEGQENMVYRPVQMAQSKRINIGEQVPEASNNHRGKISKY